MTYDEIADWLDDNIEPGDYESLEDYTKAISNEFGINMELARAFAKPFWEEYLEERFEQESLDDFEPEPEKKKEKPKEVKLTENQKNDIKNNDQNEDLTKREKTIETLKIANQEITVKQFYELNPNMIKSTARRELSTAVKRGELERVRKGVYRKL